MMRTLAFALLLTTVGLAGTQTVPPPQLLGGRSLLHAHNCYPDEGQFADRIDRALGTNLTPIVIEQDLAYSVKAGQSVVSHDAELDGTEPTLERYFFDRIRPIVERALNEKANDRWPLILLHLDFKTNEREHHKAVWDLLVKHRAWLTTAVFDADQTRISPLKPGPVLVLTENGENQEKDFLEWAAAAKTHLLFGSIPAPAIASTKDEAERARRLVTATPDVLIPTGATTYRRWVNFSWAAIEEGGASKAGAWTNADDARLQAVVGRAHAQGLLVRFYTLNGHSAAESRGWGASYNFGTIQAARERWQAAIRVGADLIATDQYEEFATVLRSRR
jgi:glycerophosphoryl diester phosphodiesterase